MESIRIIWRLHTVREPKKWWWDFWLCIVHYSLHATYKKWLLLEILPFG